MAVSALKKIPASPSARPAAAASQPQNGFASSGLDDVAPLAIMPVLPASLPAGALIPGGYDDMAASVASGDTPLAVQNRDLSYPVLKDIKAILQTARGGKAVRAESRGTVADVADNVLTQLQSAVPQRFMPDGFTQELTNRIVRFASGFNTEHVDVLVTAGQEPPEELPDGPFNLYQFNFYTDQGSVFLDNFAKQQKHYTFGGTAVASQPVDPKMFFSLGQQFHIYLRVAAVKLEDQNKSDLDMNLVNNLQIALAGEPAAIKAVVQAAQEGGLSEKAVKLIEDMAALKMTQEDMRVRDSGVAPLTFVEAIEARATAIQAALSATEPLLPEIAREIMMEGATQSLSDTSLIRNEVLAATNENVSPLAAVESIMQEMAGLSPDTAGDLVVQLETVLAIESVPSALRSEVQAQIDMLQASSLTGEAPSADQLRSLSSVVASVSSLPDLPAATSAALASASPQIATALSVTELIEAPVQLPNLSVEELQAIVAVMDNTASNASLAPAVAEAIKAQVDVIKTALETNTPLNPAQLETLGKTIETLAARTDVPTQIAQLTEMLPRIEIARAGAEPVATAMSAAVMAIVAAEKIDAFLTQAKSGQIDLKSAGVSDVPRLERTLGEVSSAIRASRDHGQTHTALTGLRETLASISPTVAAPAVAQAAPSSHDHGAPKAAEATAATPAPAAPVEAAAAAIAPKAKDAAPATPVEAGAGGAQPVTSGVEPAAAAIAPKAKDAAPATPVETGAGGAQPVTPGIEPAAAAIAPKAKDAAPATPVETGAGGVQPVTPGIEPAAAAIAPKAKDAAPATPVEAGAGGAQPGTPGIEPAAAAIAPKAKDAAPATPVEAGAGGAQPGTSGIEPAAAAIALKAKDAAPATPVETGAGGVQPVTPGIEPAAAAIAPKAKDAAPATPVETGAGSAQPGTPGIEPAAAAIAPKAKDAAPATPVETGAGGTKPGTPGIEPAAATIAPTVKKAVSVTPAETGAGGTKPGTSGIEPAAAAIALKVKDAAPAPSGERSRPVGASPKKPATSDGMAAPAQKGKTAAAPPVPANPTRVQPSSAPKPAARQSANPAPTPPARGPVAKGQPTGLKPANAPQPHKKEKGSTPEGGSCPTKSGGPCHCKDHANERFRNKNAEKPRIEHTVNPVTGEKKRISEKDIADDAVRQAAALVMLSQIDQTPPPRPTPSETGVRVALVSPQKDFKHVCTPGDGCGTTPVAAIQSEAIKSSLAVPSQEKYKFEPSAPVAHTPPQQPEPQPYVSAFREERRIGEMPAPPPELELGSGCGGCKTKNCGSCGIAFNAKADPEAIARAKETYNPDYVRHLVESVVTPSRPS